MPQKPSQTVVERARAAISLALAVVGLLGATLCYQAAVLKGVVLDTDVVVEAASGIAREDRVQDELADWIADAASQQLFAVGLADDLLARGIHLRADLRAAALAVMDDPNFAPLVSAQVRSLHTYVLVDHSQLAPMQLDPLVPSLRRALIAANPAYEGLVPDAGGLTVTLPSEAIPDLTEATRQLDRRLTLLAQVSIGLITVSLLFGTRRPKLLLLASVWAFVVALAQVVIALLLPLVASALPGLASVIAEHVARSLIPRFLAPAGALLSFAIGGMVIARRWQRQHDRRHARVGADAFLTAEPLLLTTPLNALADVALTTKAPPIDSAPQPRRRSAKRNDAVPDTPAALFDLPERVKK